MTDERTFTQKQVSEMMVNSRALLARVLQGQTAYMGDRDYYQVLGYPKSIEIEAYFLRYKRQDIARRIVDLPAIDTWKEPPALSEGDDENTDTAFVKDFDALNKRVKIWKALSSIDRLSGIGQFGILLIGFKDGGELSEPLNTEKVKGEKSILFLRPFSQASVEVADKNKDPQSPRFGLPENYTVTFDDDIGKKTVHWSRVLHVAENKLDSEVLGTPRLEGVFNLLDDKMKVVGGTAEATWLNMRPGMSVSPKEEYDWDEAAWLKAVQDYAHDQLRMFKAVGLDVDPIGTSEIADPTGPHAVVIADMAATANMPQRILIGSAGGEISAAKEDTRQWATTIVSRQLNYAEPEMLRPLIDWFVELGVLAAPAKGPGEYNVGTLQPDGSFKWPSIIELSDVEKATVTRNKAAAVNSLASIIDSTLLDDNEKRQILGLPPRETPESDFEPVEDEVFETAARNLRDRKITANQFMANFHARELERAGGLDE